MKNMFQIPFFLAVLLNISSCFSRTEPHSNIEQLLEKEQKCMRWPDDRLKSVTAKFPQGFLKGFQGQSQDEALQALAGIPDRHLDWLIEVNKKNGFAINNAGGMQGGVTEFGEYPNWIKVGGATYIIQSALQHEVGHAMRRWFDKHNSATASQWTQAVQSEANKESRNPQLNSYPRSYVGQEAYLDEYWAEAYNSFYCSPESNTDLKNYFAGTYNVLRTLSDPPVWEASSGGNNQTASGVFLAVESTSVNSPINFVATVPKEASRLYFCETADDSCLSGNATLANFSDVTPVGASRKFFRTSQSVQVADGDLRVFIAVDNSGKEVTRGQFTFAKK